MTNDASYTDTPHSSAETGSDLTSTFDVAEPIDWSDVDLDRYTVDHIFFSAADLDELAGEEPPVGSIPEIDLELQTVPWDLAVSTLLVTDPDHDVEPADPARSGLGRKVLGETVDLNPLIARLRAALARRKDTFDAATLDLAAQLGDLLAASGNEVEALVTYRQILERLESDSTAAGQAAQRTTARVVEHATAVIEVADLQPSSSVVTSLRALIPYRVPEQSDTDRRAVFQELRLTAARTAAGIDGFDSDVANRRRFTPKLSDRWTVADLEPTALTNSAAARLQVAERTAMNDPLPVSVLGEALLDSIDGLSYFPVVGWRGTRHPTRFADHLIIESPLSGSAAYDRHLDAVLRVRLRSRPEVCIGDVIHYTGCFPEDSEVLLRQWRERYQLNSRQVVINCPNLLRTRSENHDLDQGSDDTPAAHDRLSGVVVTSLNWAGAADIGALLARDWGWGFTAATRLQLEGEQQTTFGDWTDNLDVARQHARLANDMLYTSSTMLDALPSFTKRVYSLDQTKGALGALSRQPRLGRDDNPLPIVVVTSNDRRIRWVARHMLSSGGRFAVEDSLVRTRVAELHAVQADLVHAVRACDSAASPALVVEMTDHLEDGYAEQQGNDPVDADFDCFTDTAHRVRDALDALAGDIVPGRALAESTSE